MASTLTDLSPADKQTAVSKLIEHSAPRVEFYVMSLLSVAMATFGVLKGSAAVVIGSALIAPFLYPVLSLGMGIVMADHTLMSRSLWTIIRAAIYGLAVAVVLSLVLKMEGGNPNSEIALITSPTILDAAVAVVAGLAAAFATVRPGMNETLPGVAVAVALVPPLAAIGVGLAKSNWAIASGAFLTFAINVVGIVLTAVTVFSLMNFHTARRAADAAIKKEELETRR